MRLRLPPLAGGGLQYSHRRGCVANAADTAQKQCAAAPENCRFTVNTACLTAGSAVRKYTRARKLTPRMLNELIEKIEVYQAEKVDGVWQQKLTIHYHCVGVVSIPQALPLPMPDITMNTRKGVYVSCVPAEKAG